MQPIEAFALARISGPVDRRHEVLAQGNGCERNRRHHNTRERVVRPPEQGGKSGCGQHEEIEPRKGFAQRGARQCHGQR